MADNGKQTVSQRVVAARTAKAKKDQDIWEKTELFNENEENWIWVEIPTNDLFDKPFGNISLNLTEYGPGKHFVRPDIGKALNDILADRYKADMRILRPTADRKMMEIMARNGRPVTTAGVSGNERVVGSEKLSPYPTETSPYPIS